MAYVSAPAVASGATDPSGLADRFAAAMAALGPFPPGPRLAVGVSGGADSLALTLLADGWTRGRGGAVLGLIVDHGLRPEAAREAAATAARLAGRGIAARVLALRDLARGPALAERARAARMAVLRDACAAEGITDLLLGHHAADQAETVLIRALSTSGAAGMAGMAALRETATLRLLRPLLGIPPGALRDFLRAQCLDWAEDPSNTDPAALRARLRLLRLDATGDGPATRALCHAAATAGHARARAEDAIADWLAGHVTLRAEGFALLPPGPWPASALASLIRAIAGEAFPPPAQAVAALAARPAAITLHGTRLLPAGRIGAGWLLAREAAAMAGPVPALAGAVWDGRFRLAGQVPPGLEFGPLGAGAARLRRHSPLPAAIIATLPALRRDGVLFAVSHLGWPDADVLAGWSVLPAAAHPAAAIHFVPVAEG